MDFTAELNNTAEGLTEEERALLKLMAENVRNSKQPLLLMSPEGALLEHSYIVQTIFSDEELAGEPLREMLCLDYKEGSCELLKQPKEICRMFQSGDRVLVLELAVQGVGYGKLLAVQYKILSNKSTDLAGNPAYKALLQRGSSVFLRTIDGYKNCTYASEKWMDFLGNAQVLMGREWLNSIYHEDIASVSNALDESIENIKPFEICYRIKNQKGELRWILESGTPEYSEEQQRLVYPCSAIDITNRMIKEEQNNFQKTERGAERKIENFLEHTNIWAFSLTNEGRIKYVNSAFLGVAGYRRAELEGQDFFDLMIPEAHHEACRRRFLQIMNNSALSEGEFLSIPVRLSNGEEIYSHFNFIAYFDKRLHVSSVTLLGENISNRGNDTPEFSKTHDRLADFFENVSDLMFILNADLSFRKVNKKWNEKMGYRDLDLLSLRFLDLISPEERQKIKEVFASLDKTSSSARVETVFEAQNGEKIHVLGRLIASFDDDGSVKEYRAAFHDINNRILAKQTLRLYYQLINLNVENLEYESLFDKIHKHLRDIVPCSSFYVKINSLAEYQEDYYHMCDECYSGEELLKQVNALSPLELLNYFSKLAELKVLNARELKILASRSNWSVPEKKVLSWLGVPLCLGDKVIGSVGLAFYREGLSFSPKDLEVMTFVARQLAGIIDKRKKENTFQTEEARHRAIFNSGNHHFWSVDREYVFTSFNRAFQNEMG
ncbi:MAG: PAS domain S-box protein, partial [Cytophagales bacterium]|nr:PAS domain S-box protein [Cytophagales bacterium]